MHRVFSISIFCIIPALLAILIVPFTTSCSGNVEQNDQHAGTKSNIYTTASEYIERGTNREASSQLEMALADFSNAVELDPSNPLTWKLRGAVYYRLEHYQKAISDLTKAIELDPSKPEPYLYRGNAYGEMDMFSNAIADFNRAREAENGDYFENLKQAHTAILEGDFQTALARATSATDERPTDSIAHTYRGIALHGISRFGQAVDAFNIADAIDPDNPAIMFNRGLSNLAHSRPSDAVSDFSSALSIDSSLGAALKYRAVAYDHLGMPIEAEADRKMSK